MEPRFDQVVEIFACFMLIMGLMVSLSRTIHRMILYYQFECVGLAIITFLTALDLIDEGYGVVSGLFVIIPVLLALFIKPLLAQATVTENVPVGRRLRRWFQWSFRSRTHQQILPDWLQSRRARPGILALLGMNLFIVTLAFVTAYTFAGPAMDQSKFLSLAVSLSLLLLGLSTMVTAGDTISQVIGLLVMEQGMFLAAVRCIQNNELRTGFILGLFLYTIITLTILVLLLPELHQKSGSLDIEQQTRLKG